MRQIALDTETTGIETSQGHRIIEIGCVEIENRRLTGRHFHTYLNPQRKVDSGAFEVHGLSDQFLADKPLFIDIVEEFLQFITGAELIIHNAPFDVGFLNSEFRLWDKKARKIEALCSVVDTLVMAKKAHPGQKNNLDALCSRYGVDNSQRELHGALLDAEILADLYLVMTGGQVSFDFTMQQDSATAANIDFALRSDRAPLRIIRATDEELVAHQRKLDAIEKQSGVCIWKS